MSKLKLLRTLKDDEKIAPQARVFYDVLAGIGVGKEVDRKHLIETVEKSGKLETRQSVERVLGYYLMHFKKINLVEVIKPERAPKAEKKDKPAKENSPAEAAPKPEKAV